MLEFVPTSKPTPEPIGRMMGLKTTTEHQLDEVIAHGLPYQAATKLVDTFSLISLTQEQICEILHIPESTLRKRRKDGRFTPEESERIARIAEIAAQAIELTGNKETGLQWLNTPRGYLKSKTPLEVASTERGARKVLTYIQQLKAGVYV